MRHAARYLSTFCWVLSLLLCVAVCVLWARGRTGYDQVEWGYDRYLRDQSAASNHVVLKSDKRLWLTAYWGHVGPYNGQLVWGYYVNADNSGGHPRLRFYHQRYEQIPTWGLPDVDEGAAGIGPFRWQTGRRDPPKYGDHFRYLRIGVSHWLIASLLAILPACAWRRSIARRRSRRLGLCPVCGYDLRATPDRCPECGAVS